MIGNVLKQLREEKNVTQDQLANFLCVKRQTYSAYERNVSVPDANTIKKLSGYFSVSADDLLEVEKTNLQGQPLAEAQQKIAIASKGLLPDEIEKVIEYVEFVKAKRK